MDLGDILGRGRLSRFDLPERRPSSILEAFGKYGLFERVVSGPEDECYWARFGGLAGFERFVFVRRFASDRMDEATVDAIKRQAHVMLRGIATIFELGRIEPWGFVVGEVVAGASVAAMVRARRRVPWLAALALVFDTCSRIMRVYDRYVGEDIDLALSPARIFLTHNFEVTLSMGVPKPTQPAWHQTLCGVIHPILALAADERERAMLRELFTDDNPDAVWVACDALVERHPELDPMLPMVFLALAGRAPRDEVHAALVEAVPGTALQALWQLAVDVAAGRC